MSKRLIFCKVMIFATVLASLPVLNAQTPFAGSLIRISSYQDDPFVDESRIQRIDGSQLVLNADGRRILSNNEFAIVDEAIIYLEDPQTGNYVSFATNPWPQPASNEKGNFRFELEKRFPLHQIERGPDGKPVLNEDGLQIWKPREIYLGMTTVFKAASAAKQAAEFWSGRVVNWGGEGYLKINSHAFIDFNAFFSPSAETLFFGVVPYRPPGQGEVFMFEMGTSWETGVHESGHALHAVLKPNRYWSELGYRTWSESFGDQLAMWASLRDPDRAASLLADTNGDLNQTNAMTRMGEALGGLIGDNAPMRNAFHDKKVSDTNTEVHERSEVLTGAAYKIFLLVYSGLKNEGKLGEQEALEQAADVMGTFLIRSADYISENSMTLEQVSKAYLKVDKEFFGGRYHQILADEFIKRELFDSTSVGEWVAHEAAVPDIRLPKRQTNRKLERLLQANLNKLDIWPEFGLILQSVTRDTRFGQTIVRVQLTDGRGDDAPLLDNHGILTFRTDGTLADYHSPIPSADNLQALMKLQGKVPALMSAARTLRIDQHSVPLSIVRRSDGQFSVEATVMRTAGSRCWVEAFTLEHPNGERREVIVPTFPGRISGYHSSRAQILTVEELKQ